MNPLVKKTIFVIFFLIFSNLSLAQFPFDLQTIMKGNEFIGHQPENPRWSWDSKTLFFDWNPTNNPGNSIYFWEEGMAGPMLLPAERYHETFLCDADQAAFKIRFYIRENALYSFNTELKKHTLHYKTNEQIFNLQRVNNPNKVYFQQGMALFCFDLFSGSTVQIVQFVKSSKESDQEPSFLEKQQDSLFEIIRNKKTKQAWNEAERKKYLLPEIKQINIGNDELSDVSISLDENHVIYRLEEPNKLKSTDVPHYVTTNGHLFIEKAREKVSITNLNFYHCYQWKIQADTILKLDFSALTDLNKKPSYLTDAALYPEKRHLFMHRPIYSPKESMAVMDIRSLDNKDRWLVSIDLNSSSVFEWDHQHDEAWIGGPGIGEWDFYPGTLGYFSDGKTVFYQSEKTGFSHLYSYSSQTKEKRTITSGNWEVREVNVLANGAKLYCSTNTSHPGNRDVYRYDFLSNKWEKLIEKVGASELSVSPNEKKWAIRFSTSNQPWELFVAQSGKSWKQLTKSTTKEFQQYAWKKASIVSLKASDNTQVNARIYQPEEGKKNGAAIIFVHGAGYLQNAHLFWSSYSREYLFHHFLVEQGYTVLDIDYRGSDGYGRDFRTGIYRHMGGLDLEDQLLGREYLIQLGIDSNRIGIYGGSYGGFITLMALFTEPGAFKAGAALRSVTDWAHYNHPYTSNILNFPETDPEAYKQSSPIYFAENLQDHLLILHGMIDDNVQFQDVVRLNQRLIELKKKNWEMAIYPVERHGFVNADSWYDEYRRIWELFDKTLK